MTKAGIPYKILLQILSYTSLSNLIYLFKVDKIIPANWMKAIIDRENDQKYGPGYSATMDRIEAVQNMSEDEKRDAVGKLFAESKPLGTETPAWLDDIQKFNREQEAQFDKIFARPSRRNDAVVQGTVTAIELGVLCLAIFFLYKTVPAVIEGVLYNLRNPGGGPPIGNQVKEVQRLSEQRGNSARARLLGESDLANKRTAASLAADSRRHSEKNHQEYEGAYAAFRDAWWKEDSAESAASAAGKAGPQVKSAPA